jgi:RNA polymerase sigma-70 factor (ECF subfamily)
VHALAWQGATGMPTETAVTESVLIRRIAQGDRHALAELYAQYQRPLFAYLLHLTPDHGLVEELLQDTLVAVWKSAASFEGRSGLLTWLIGIARRQAHNTLRQQKPMLDDYAELEHLPATEQEPEAFVLANVARDELVAAFQALPPVHREVLVLTFIHERSYQETAEILEVPLGTVKSRLNHARRALRAELDAGEDAK